MVPAAPVQARVGKGDSVELVLAPSSPHDSIGQRTRARDRLQATLFTRSMAPKVRSGDCAEIWQ